MVVMPRSARHCRKFILWACLVVLSGNSLAQAPAGEIKPAAAALPGWIVLVLKPIGAERVRPVTGVVIAEQGLVIVPLDFAAPGDQIIVLDGGTDIIANGRAATVKQQITDAGLTVLSVPGLKRSPASLSAMLLADGENIRLAAFPPAEQIAQGAAPVWVETQVSVTSDASPAGGEAQSRAFFAAGKALPNVSGPLLDGCGNLIGFSSADGVQSMDTTKAPAYLWKDGLLRALQDLPLALTEAPCPAIAVAAPAETAAEAAAPQPDSVAPAPDSNEPDAPAAQDTTARVDASPTATPRSRLLPWLGLLAAAILAGLLGLRYRRRVISTRRNVPAGSAGMSAGEPQAQQIPAAAPGPPDVASQADCVVEISGRLPDGTPFLGSCDVNGAAINLVIGRGRADIVIDSADVHREHARLSGSADMLTISDLGSSRGTWINRVPCLRGEIMYIGSEDTIFLGDVSFQVSVRTRQPGGTVSSEHS
jgi:hypothetical protein